MTVISPQSSRVLTVVPTFRRSWERKSSTVGNRSPSFLMKVKLPGSWVVSVAQLAEWSLPILEVSDSNPNIDQLFMDLNHFSPRGMLLYVIWRSI